MRIVKRYYKRGKITHALGYIAPSARTARYRGRKRRIRVRGYTRIVRARYKSMTKKLNKNKTDIFRKALREKYPELKKWSYGKLETELTEFQSFLNNPDSSIGRQDMYYEQALISELAYRDKKMEKLEIYCHAQVKERLCGNKVYKDGHCRKHFLMFA